MTVSVLVPYRPDGGWRDRAWQWVAARYRQHHPDWEIVTGAHLDGPFSRTQAILAAAANASGDTLVVADADVWCDGIAAAVAAASVEGWAIPHWYIHRLAPASTEQVLAGGDWRGLPLSTDNPQDSRPYKGHATGTLVVLTRAALEAAPPDPRFVGWGQEDDAWAAALRCLVGQPWRGRADLVHLWHPAQPRLTRRVGNPAGESLWERYRDARHDPDRMRALIQEARCSPTPRSSS